MLKPQTLYFSQNRFLSVPGEKLPFTARTHTVIINSESWLGSSVSLNGSIHVNHSCLQAGLGSR